MQEKRLGGVNDDILFINLCKYFVAGSFDSSEIYNFRTFLLKLLVLSSSLPLFEEFSDLIEAAS